MTDTALLKQDFWRNEERIMKPILLKSTFKDYLWGGTKLRDLFNKESDLERIAESWELSTHKDGESIVNSGEYKGKTLGQYIDLNGKGVLGKNCEKFDDFPILIKLIDAKDNLSLQVHPSDDYAIKNEGQYGKTEVWYVLDAEENSALYYGFNKTITKQEYKKRIEDNTLTDVLNRVEAKKGDVFFVEPGTVHAIGKGLLICEVQQNSNITYRVYDYNRRGADGKLRELHIDKAVEVSNLNKKELPKDNNNLISKDGFTKKEFASCKYFTCEDVKIQKGAVLPMSEDSFISLTIIDGSAVLKSDGESLNLKLGDTVFIPAQNGTFEIEGTCEFIESKV